MYCYTLQDLFVPTEKKMRKIRRIEETQTTKATAEPNTKLTTNTPKHPNELHTTNRTFKNTSQ